MGRTAITNVLVFDGKGTSGPRTVVIDGELISGDTTYSDEDTVVDGTGCTLLPGLFDCHVHIRDAAQLASCASWGITTVCDMACWPHDKFQALRAAGRKGPTLWLGAGLPGFAEDSTHGRLMRMLGVGRDAAIHNVAEATQFVRDRAAEDVDYVKIIGDAPGLEQACLDEIQREAGQLGKMTVAHTAHHDAFPRALRAGFDVLTHVPMDRALGGGIIEGMARQKTVLVPTLTMMEGLSRSWVFWLLRGKVHFQCAVDSVAAMKRAGLPILAGTDANNSPVGRVVAGPSLHHELELLVRAGLTPCEALTSATALPAEYFKLHDRGSVKPGLRADLLLVEGNPTEDVTLTRNIQRVWSGGKQVQSVIEKDGRCVTM